ncbi:MAG: hypothetical protein IPN12_00195 [Rhodocyclaceae bacterium]|nr:hypothetical protein [Rhodocyclaceae bacterium]
MLLLDDMRAEFARFLYADSSGRWRMDKALGHVVKLAYEAGIAAGKASLSNHITTLDTENIDMRARLDRQRLLNILNQHAAPAEANIAANRIIDGLRIKEKKS